MEFDLLDISCARLIGCVPLEYGLWIMIVPVLSERPFSLAALIHTCDLGLCREPADMFNRRSKKKSK